MKFDFEKGNGLIPAVVQDARTKDVLMVGYMNREALDRTRNSGLVTFYSRSKGRLWTKGETSGNTLTFLSAKADCDGDAILIQAVPSGPVCHTGEETCFGEKESSGFLYQLEALIEHRKNHAPKNSYTSSLFGKGLNKIAQKFGEEAVEVLIEAKDNSEEKFLNECADLLYHFLVLLRQKEVDLSDIEEILKSRHTEEKG